MDNLLKIVVIGFLGIIGAMVAIQLVKGLIGLLMPLLVIGAAGYVVYRLVKPKSSLGGRGGGYLP
ncbi:MAG: hypothetical protein J0L72_10940 [Armatimonadetes bacterium]|nr:hypothetical protein [Armatimonadota bacterium]